MGSVVQAQISSRVLFTKVPTHTFRRVGYSRWSGFSITDVPLALKDLGITKGKLHPTGSIRSTPRREVWLTGWDPVELG